MEWRDEKAKGNKEASQPKEAKKAKVLARFEEWRAKESRVEVSSKPMEDSELPPVKAAAKAYAFRSFSDTDNGLHNISKTMTDLNNNRARRATPSGSAVS